MIRCKPIGWFSWNFSLQGDGHEALLEFNLFGEQGRATIDGTKYEVLKPSLLLGEWTLVHHDLTIATASQTNVFTRSFELLTPLGNATLRPKSVFQRTMLIEGGGYNATIRPNHPFTIASTITGTCPDFRVVCFAFWLTAQNWRRKANSD